MSKANAKTKTWISDAQETCNRNRDLPEVFALKASVGWPRALKALELSLERLRLACNCQGGKDSGDGVHLGGCPAALADQIERGML